MKTYIGTKIVNAEPMTYHEFQQSKGILSDMQSDAPGYMVCYEDGYISWSPKETFERAYREVTQQEVKLIQALR